MCWHYNRRCMCRLCPPWTHCVRLPTKVETKSKAKATDYKNKSAKILSWEKQVREFMQSHGCAETFAPWTSRPDVVLRGVPDCVRDRAILNCAWVARNTKLNWPGDAIAKASFYADTHDSVIRSPWGKLMPLKQNQSIYSFERDAVLSGWAHMRLHGWPTTLNVEGFSDSELRGLAGEAYALPPCTLMHVAYYLNPFASWW